MQYIEIPGLKKPLSRLIQGTVMLHQNHNADEAAFFALFDALYEQGCTTFDTAHVYQGGESEIVFGRWLAERKLRDKVVILDKGAHHNEVRKRLNDFDISADIYDSLARLQTDYIDLYLLHRDDPEKPVGPIVEALYSHQRAGRIHAYGASNWSAARIEAANAYALDHDYPPFVVSSPHFSLAEQVEAPWDDCLSITGEAAAQERAWYAQHALPVLSWSSLAGGWFSGRLNRKNQAKFKKEDFLRCYASPENWERLERVKALARKTKYHVAQIALAYVLQQPFQTLPLVAAYKPEEFASSVAALDISLSETEIAWLNLDRDSLE